MQNWQIKHKLNQLQLQIFDHDTAYTNAYTVHIPICHMHQQRCGGVAQTPEFQITWDGGGEMVMGGNGYGGK